MGWGLTLLLAIVMAVAAAFAAGFVADSAAVWLRMSQREGAAGYFAILMGLLGGLGGLVTAMVVGRHASGFLPALGLSLAIMGGVIALVAGLAWLGADREPLLRGRALSFDIEIRVPHGAPLDPRNSHPLYAYVSAEGAPMEMARLGFLRPEADGATIVPGRVRLSTGRAGPYFAVGGHLVGGGTIHVMPGLAGLPDPDNAGWSGWIAGTPAGTAPPAEAQGVMLRFRPVWRDAPE